jgi:hypothetical protein
MNTPATDSAQSPPAVELTKWVKQVRAVLRVLTDDDVHRQRLSEDGAVGLSQLNLPGGSPPAKTWQAHCPLGHEYLDLTPEGAMRGLLTVLLRQAEQLLWRKREQLQALDAVVLELRAQRQAEGEGSS